MQKTDYLNACRILFPENAHLTPGFLKDLEISSLKTAYRQKAFETHPDRSVALGISEMEMEKRFKDVASAYELLLPVACGKYSFLFNANVQKKQGWKTSKRKKTPNDHYHIWGIPQKELLLGQYLYYSGMISWKTLLKSIAWQRNHQFHLLSNLRMPMSEFP